jgi:hypothetical protein
MAMTPEDRRRGCGGRKGVSGVDHVDVTFSREFRVWLEETQATAARLRELLSSMPKKVLEKAAAATPEKKL